MDEVNESGTETVTKAAKLREIAANVRSNPLAREAIADGFDLIADLMDDPCTDCTSQQGQAVAADLPVIDSKVV